MSKGAYGLHPAYNTFLRFIYPVGVPNRRSITFQTAEVFFEVMDISMDSSPKTVILAC